MVNYSSESLDRVFGALADPTRRAILSRLSLGETTVKELAAPFQISLPAVTKHLKVLEHAGLITRGRHAQWRPCRLEVKPLQEADKWISAYQHFWTTQLDALDHYLASETENNP